MAKKLKKFKNKKKDKMMKKMAGKNFDQYRNQEPLLKSGESTTTDIKPVDKENYNRADSMLRNLTQNTGIPRQKVRMK